MNKEQIQDNLKVILTLEYLGVHIEDTKEETDKYGITSKQVYYFSVPEKSTIELEDKELNGKIKTSYDLITLAKEELLNMVIESCKNEFGKDDEFIKEVENDISNYLKFYAKVRNGEVWNKELGNKAIKKITDELKNVSRYKEV